MIRLHIWNTPHGQKPDILLEEVGLTYDIAVVDIGAGAKKDKAFRALNPKSKILALRDGGPTIFESGAILLHLAETHGRFLPVAAANLLSPLPATRRWIAKIEARPAVTCAMTRLAEATKKEAA